MGTISYVQLVGDTTQASETMDAAFRCSTHQEHDAWHSDAFCFQWSQRLTHHHSLIVPITLVTDRALMRSTQFNYRESPLSGLQFVVSEPFETDDNKGLIIRYSSN